MIAPIGMQSRQKLPLVHVAHYVVSQSCYGISFGVAYRHSNYDVIHMRDGLFFDTIS